MSRPYFTRTTVDIYTQGECYALALELHRRTGWPVVAVCGDEFEQPVTIMERGQPVERWTHGMYHFAVLTPEGLALDVTGARLLAHMKLHWQALTVKVPENQEGVLHDLGTHWQPLDDFEPTALMRRRDRRIARRVLAGYQGHAVDFVPHEWWTLDPFSIGMGQGLTPDVVQNYRRLQDAGVFPKRIRCEYLIRDALRDERQPATM